MHLRMERLFCEHCVTNVYFLFFKWRKRMVLLVEVSYA